MKKTYTLSTFIILLFTTCIHKQDVEVPDDQATLSVKQFSNGDYQFVIGDSLIKALVSPNDGGKLISLKYRGQEILVSQEIDPIAYGSTFWPSPHDWGWPPPKEIDRASYTSEIKDNVLIMEGAIIEKMGLQFIKHFSIGVEDTTLHFKYIIVNVSDDSKKIAPWEVSRVPKGGFTFFPVNKEYKAFEAVPSGRVERLYYCSVPSSYAGRSQKINFNATQGWLAHASNGVLLVKKFRDLSASEIAPKEGDVEIYIDDNTNYIELENQGKYVELFPGDSISYQTTWFLRENPYNSTVENINKLERLAKRIVE